MQAEIYDTRIGRFKMIPIANKKQLVDVEIESMGVWMSMGQMRIKDFQKMIQHNKNRGK